MKIVEELKNILAEEDNILFAYLFGSYAKGDFHKSSDIDIALYLKEDSFDYYLEIVKKLQSLFDKEIDMVILNRAKNLFLIEDIINNSVVLKDNEKRLEYESYKWMEIVDFKEVDKRLENASY